MRVIAEDAPDFSGSCMIALHPPAQLAQTLAVDGGLDAVDLHVTVAYTGRAADVDPAALTAVAEAVADRAPIDATVSGHARFTGGADGDVIVVLIDSPGLEDLRRDVVDALAAHGITLPRDHGYCPHLTLTYLPPGQASPIDRLPPIPVTFAAISVVHGDTRKDVAFTGAGHPIGPAAREAFTVGWRLSGAPWGERAARGAAAAGVFAADHEHHDDVFEATLKLGALEGAWARVFDRRETLIAAHVAKVTKLWKQILADLSPSDLIRQARYAAGAGPGHITAPKAEAVAYATSAARRWLGGVYRDDRYQALVDAVRDAMHAAAAEGQAAAGAVAAEIAPTEAAGTAKGYDFDLAFDDAYRALDAMSWPADEWVQRIILGNGTDLGHLLGDLIANETPYEEMVAAIRDLTGATDIRAVSALLDQAMLTALNQGAVDLYNREGVAAYDVLTAGDARVCKACEDAEAGSPYAVTETSPVPLHPFCRCAVTARLPESAYLQYLHDS